MDLLMLLAASPGATVTKDEILRHLWPDIVVEEGGIALCVSELRMALGDDARYPVYIQTRPRHGYRLIAEVAIVQPEVPTVAAAPAGRRWHPSLFLLVPPVAAIGLAIVPGVWRASRLGGQPPVDPTPRAAVVALRNLSENEADGWIGDAVAHLLTAELVSVSDLRLVPREVISRARRELPLAEESDTRVTARQLRLRLAVDYVFGGHYVVAEGRSDGLRLDVTVADGATGEVLAAAVESGPRDRLPEMVTFAALELRDALGLGERPRDDGVAGRVGDAELPAAYFQALLHLERYETETARTLLESAVAEVPTAPWPRLALAEAWSHLGYDRQAAELVNEALVRAPALAGEDRLWFEARANLLAERPSEAIERFEALALLDPSNLEYRLALATARVEAGRVEAALDGLGELTAREMTETGDPRLPIVAGEAALGMGDARRAIALAEVAIARSRRLRAQAAEGRALFLLARARFIDGEIPAAEDALERARGRFVLARDRPGEARAATTFSQWLERRGEVGRAEQEARAALAVSQAIGDRSGEAEALRLLGPQLWQKGDRDQGEAALRRALAIVRETDDRLAEAATLSDLAVASARWSEGPVRPLFARALAIYRQLGHRSGIRNTLMNLGRLALIEGAFGAALAAYREVEELGDELDPESRAMVAYNLGYIYQSLGEIGSAEASFRIAADLFDRLESPAMLGASLEGLGSTALIAGDLPRATSFLWSALRVRQRLGHAVRIARAEVALARARIELGQMGEAERLLDDALARSDREGGFNVRRAVLEARADLHLASGHLDRALDAVTALEALDSGGKGWLTISGVSRQVTVARVRSATGRYGEAASSLTRAIAFFEGHDAVVLLLEARLALLENQHARGEVIDADQLAAIEKRARARGLKLLARQLASLRLAIQQASEQAGTRTGSGASTGRTSVWPQGSLQHAPALSEHVLPRSR